jgi:hypothetical protein
MFDMRRREFITLLGGMAATWSSAAPAQQGCGPLIGALMNISENDPSAPIFMAAFRLAALRATAAAPGWISWVDLGPGTQTARALSASITRAGIW